MAPSAFMASSPAPALRRPPLDACTGLRFFAALGVVSYHFYCPPCEPNAPAFLGNLFRAGFTTVSLFFVLSGFILAYNYLDERGGFVGTTRDFYRARFARIYPIYLLALAVDLPLFLRLLSHAEPTAAPGEVAQICAATLTLTQAWLEGGRPVWNTMAWTLSAEAFFYALFPFLGVWLARQSSRRLLSVAVSAWVLGMAPFLAGELVSSLGAQGTGALTVRILTAWSELPSQLVPLLRLPEFVLGLCLGLLFCRRTRQGSQAWRTAGLITTIGAIAAVLILLPPTPSAIVQMGVLVPLFAVCIWLLACGVAWSGMGMGTRPLLRLGGASYALYLTHGSLMGFALALNTRTLTLPHNTVALLLAPAAVAASLVLFQFVEEPARHWLRKAPRRVARTGALG
ncbi:acyltransferase family protein [Hyalangium minutum]|uniref:Acyltransferase family protein n=1 Tax=Hyalangium minutum TaxID=394096 RepID=A0A085WUY8_9BACT|nr:acyltransferase [Hyalangium minutum]KFE71501.1 acyltransferase family protein [Hyalangium minutum]